ncbi:Uncharacterized iron-regulated membrane protein [Moraxella cuniculi]|uniref:Uncharacterized iron-regulated membrane protein n=2 Tax=Moraxella cuniculi TaxID=34061 RepID=A0A3S4QRY9_9GAMM|nr:Uncharacterized iron-regulated membrane protein [Moraxella cuniculi]
MMNTKTKQAVKKANFRQILAPVHTWTGLILGWLLFLIFFMGTLSYFKDEINIWSMPHIYQQIGKSQDWQLATAAEYAVRNYPDAKQMFIDSGDDRSPLTIRVQPSNDRNNVLQLVASQDGRFVSADNYSQGGEFFYRLHFDLHYMPVRYARYLVGFASMMMLIAIITGVVIHKKFFADFFTFRAKKGQRSWLDAHNALSVLPLPFHFFITFTGIITLVGMYLPFSEKVAGVSGDVRAPFLAFDWWAKPSEGVKPSPPPDIYQLIDKSKKSWKIQSDYAIARISINYPNTSDMTVAIEADVDKQFSVIRPFYVYNQQSALIRQTPPIPSGVLAQTALVGLHEGKVADYWLRVILFILGALGVGMIATGLVLWTIKRKEKLKAHQQAGFGFVLVDGLNIATIMGLPLATVAFLWANRILPSQYLGRDNAEILIFFITWATALVLAFILPKKLAWAFLGYATALALLLLPVVSMVMTDRGFVDSWINKDWLFVIADILFVLFALLFCYIAHKIWQYQPPTRFKKQSAMEQL